MSEPAENTYHKPNIDPQGWLGQAVTCGFAMALVMWTTWFVTHLPWVGLAEPARVGIVLLAWFAAAAVLTAPSSMRTAAAAGLVSALLGLLLLGSKLVEPVPASPQPGAVRPNALVIALGYLALGATMVAAGWAAGRLLPKAADTRQDWLARFSIVAAVTIAVLLFIGGLVTSTGAGMAVPDWPRTYGANMFLYPLSGAAANVFLEHSHRLFGTLVGLATITLLIWTFVREKRGWVKVIAAVILALVITQGVIGGFRVTGNSRALAMLHGVLGQLTFGIVVAMAAFLAPAFKGQAGRCSCGYPLGSLPATDGRVTCPECGTVNRAPGEAEPAQNFRRLRFLSTGFLHATILQLILGAMHRHFRDNHSLYSHIALSLVVVFFAVGAGFMSRTVQGSRGGIGPILRRLGAWTVAVVGVQFLLGWVAFMAGGRTVAAATAGQALIRTIHQANGAFVLALAVLGFVWTRRLLRNQAG